MDAPEKNISHVVFGSYEIKAWYYSPYVLDGLVRPDTTDSAPLRLNGGFSGEMPVDDEDANMTDSTDVDDSMQRLPEASTSSRPASPAIPRLVNETSATAPLAGPSTARPAVLRKAARTAQINGRHSSPTPKVMDGSFTPSNLSKSRKERAVQAPVKLYVCEGCFKYMVHPASYAIHFRSCRVKHPPGRKVYQKGAHTIWEVDGEAQKLYCQNLCLFGKLFIDHKYVFFETSGFLFYVLTEARPSFDHVFGFFSKEKISYNDYNLACIVTFPPFQKRGYGTLMIEFSYELSSRSLYSRRAGTPERPLSDLGLRGYLQFWTSVLVRYFRLIFFTQNDPRLAVSAQAPITSRPKHRKKVRGFEGEIAPDSVESLAVPQNQAKDTKTVPTSPEPTRPLGKSPSQQDSAAVSQEEKQVVCPEKSEPAGDPTAREVNTSSAFEMQFSLAEIAHATDLREEDVAFTLVHSGLASFRSPLRGFDSAEFGAASESTQTLVPAPHEMQIVITAAIVEDVAARFKVKQQPVLSKLHCLF